MSTREERAATRAGWPVRRVELRNEGAEEDLRLVTTPLERLAMMEQLAEDAFPAGPDYPRNAAPGRVVRPPR